MLHRVFVISFCCLILQGKCGKGSRPSRRHGISKPYRQRRLDACRRCAEPPGLPHQTNPSRSLNGNDGALHNNLGGYRTRWRKRIGGRTPQKNKCDFMQECPKCSPLFSFLMTFLCLFPIKQELRCDAYRNLTWHRRNDKSSINSSVGMERRRRYYIFSLLLLLI